MGTRAIYKFVLRKYTRHAIYTCWLGYLLCAIENVILSISFKIKIKKIACVLYNELSCYAQTQFAIQGLSELKI